MATTTASGTCAGSLVWGKDDDIGWQWSAWGPGGKGQEQGVEATREAATEKAQDAYRRLA